VIEGALIALAGVLIGRFLPGRRRHPKTPRPTPPPKPMCGCTHHYAMHDPATKACHGTVKTPQHNSIGHHVGYTYPACACRQYVGPVPMPEFFASEIGG